MLYAQNSISYLDLGDVLLHLLVKAETELTKEVESFPARQA